MRQTGYMYNNDNLQKAWGSHDNLPGPAIPELIVGEACPI